MQKNRPRSQSSNDHSDNHSYIRYPIPEPDVIDMDAIGSMLDEDVLARLRSLEDDVNRLYEMGFTARPWEEEIAYIRREQQLRRTRREVHEAYVKRLDREYSISEANLPSADLDNSRFFVGLN